MDWPAAIAGFTVIWLVVGIGGTAGLGVDLDLPTGAMWAIFFWPVTLPIFLVTGLIRAILYSIIMGCKVIGGKV